LIDDGYKTNIIAKNSGNNLITEKPIDFVWFPGLSVSQKQKSISSLHNAARKDGINNILEISTKSDQSIGRKLSSFNLTMKLPNGRYCSVEAAFQSSKVFEYGGPFLDLLISPGREIKKDIRLKESGKLIKFIFFNDEWKLEPKTAFYDWLYINALNSNSIFTKEIIKYDAFTDIEFNPSKSINCQARSAALFVNLYRKEVYSK
jgi:hypothetical protein